MTKNLSKTRMTNRLRRHGWLAAAALGLAPWLGGAATALAQGGSFINFETIPTRAVALSPDGKQLFVTNVPDGRLEIFRVGTGGALTSVGSVPVGLDPVAVEARTNGEVWVVNFLSDSVSIVDVATMPPRVVNTLLVGDEPRDVVFGGPNRSRAFVSATRRGQNHPLDTVNETQVPGVPRADVWVFDTAKLGTKLGGEPLAIVPLFSDKPGAMTVSPDGSTVFVSIRTSGNRTTAVADKVLCGTDNLSEGAGPTLPKASKLEDVLPLLMSPANANPPPGTQNSREENGPCQLPNGGRSPGGVPGPNVAADGTLNPRTATIVRFDEKTGAWLDAGNRDFRDAVPFTLPDNDVFAIDANANPPVQLRAFQHVGTLNANLAVNPQSGKTFVATIEAVNKNRFISVPRLGLFPNPNRLNGRAATADPLTGETLNGHLYEARISILSPDGSVVTRHLNKHIDYEVVPSPAGVKERSIADPEGVLFSPDGQTLFVAGLGSNQIVAYKTAELEDDSFVPDASTHIQLSGDGGPTDMVLDAGGQRMFVYKRFDNAVATVDLATRKETAVTKLFNPEPDDVRVGRKFFYDATLGSSNGEANCSVCHPGADKDDLAWDFGQPFGSLSPNPNPFVPAPAIVAALFPDPVEFNRTAATLVSGGAPVSPTIEFNPLKGPMTVLTLRGIKDSGPLFWRGDATNADNPLDVRKNFQNFNLIFEALLGRDGQLPQENFDQLSNWVMTLMPPPNPYRALDNSLNASQKSGENIFLGGEGSTDVIFKCVDCHGLDPAKGFFGTRGEDVVEGETQFFKVTQLRTTYDKLGMFGATTGLAGDERLNGGPRNAVGDQIRGFGTAHDGSFAAVEEFLSDNVFQLDARQLKEVTDFVAAFPSNLAPVVGQQATLRIDSGKDTDARIDLLEQRAGTPFTMPGGLALNATECDLVARGMVGGRVTGFLFRPATKTFLADSGDVLSDTALRTLGRSPGGEVTFTCVYPGGGQRIGLDRDGDGTPDGASNVRFTNN